MVTESDYGLTPEQYHAGLDKLWAALGVNRSGERDIFTECADRIRELEDALCETYEQVYDNQYIDALVEKIFSTESDKQQA